MSYFFSDGVSIRNCEHFSKAALQPSLGNTKADEYTLALFLESILANTSITRVDFW